MPARKKSGKITLRMDSDIHKRVAKTAKALGMDINGLLNLIIRTHLPRHEMQARLAQMATAKARSVGLKVMAAEGINLGDIYSRLKELATEMGEMSDAVFEGFHDQLMDEQEQPSQERSEL